MQDPWVVGKKFGSFPSNFFTQPCQYFQIVNLVHCLCSWYKFTMNNPSNIQKRQQHCFDSWFGLTEFFLGSWGIGSLPLLVVTRHIREMHYLQFPPSQTRCPATHICPLWWIIWWACDTKNLHEANRCHRCVRDACHCFLHHVIESRVGGIRLSGPLPAGHDVLGTNSHNIIIFVFYLQDWPRMFPGVVFMPLTE